MPKITPLMLLNAGVAGLAFLTANAVRKQETRKIVEEILDEREVE